MEHECGRCRGRGQVPTTPQTGALGQIAAVGAGVGQVMPKGLSVWVDFRLSEGMALDLRICRENDTKFGTKIPDNRKSGDRIMENGTAMVLESLTDCVAAGFAEGLARVWVP